LENSAIWGLTHDYYAISSIGGFADPVPPLHRRSSNVPPVRWRQRRYARDVDTDQDPLAITEINQLIGRATGQQPRTHPTNQSAGQSGKQSSKCPGNRSGKQPAKRRRKRQQKQPEEPTPAQHGHNTKTCIPLPLEIVIMIVDALYKNDNYSRPRIKDTRNLLEAFRWKLPDWYWQGRCRKDFIFEFDDLIKSGDPSVDWQYLCLDSERMLHDFRWYDGSGLKNRSRIICLLRAIESQFRDLLEEEDAGA
jgi:hypothetical protein